MKGGLSNRGRARLRRIAARNRGGGYAGRTFQPGKGSLTGRVLLARKTVQIEDMSTDPDYDPSSAPTMIPQTLLGVPIMRDGDVAGLIIVRRYHVALFNAREIEILETFSRQAAIAIENVRLLNETREALDQQTALGNVLQSMSRSVFDLDTVLTTLVEQAARLCDAEKGSIHRYDGEVYRTAAFWGANITAEYKRVALDTVRRPGRDTLIGRAALERDVVHIPDVLADPEYKAGDVQRVGGYRTALAVPLLQRVDRSANQFARFSWRIHMRQRDILIYFYILFNTVDTLVLCRYCASPLVCYADYI